MDEERLGFNRASMAHLLLACLFAWMAFNWFETLQRIVHCYTAVPVEDYWRVAYYLTRYRAPDIRVLWMQHNEHRIVFPEIVFALDMLLWHGRQILPLGVSFLCYLSAWIVLAWTLFTDRSLSSTVRNVAILLAAILMGWKGSASVLAVPFLLQWTLMQLCVVLSLAFIARVRRAEANGCLVVAIASAIVATYSSANALLLWPLLVAAAVLLRLSARQLIALGIAAVASVGFYFIGYKFSNNLNIGNLVSHPLYFLGFLGAYLSMPFGAIKSSEFGVCVGLISLLIVIALFVIAARVRLLLSQPGIVFFGYYSFTLLSAVLTAAGRMDPADPTFSTAKATRYLTLPLLNWAVFVSLCLWLASRCRWKIVCPAAITFAVAVLVFIGFLKMKWWLEASDNDFAGQQVAALGLGDGLTDPGLIRKIFPDPSLVFGCLPELHKNNLAVYYRSRVRWLGRPVKQFSQVLSAPTAGAMNYVFPVRSGLEVVGWADEYSRGIEYRWVVLANEAGQIVGFGQRLPAGFPGDLRSLATPASIAWVGFVNLEIKTRFFSAYVVDPHRTGLFPIPGSFPVPPIEAASLDELGAPIPGIEWRKDPTWRLDGFPPLRFDTPPPDPIYGTWSGAGATGQLSSSAFPTSKACTTLPVLHGPSITGLSVDIQDADTDKWLESAPMQNGDTQWEFWRLSLDPAVKHLRVTARDQGRNRGEWLAVGPPSDCR